MAADVRPGSAPDAAADAGQPPQDPPADAAAARFSLVYQSRDGRLCLFQDGEGHLTAVRATKLA